MGSPPLIFSCTFINHLKPEQFQQRIDPQDSGFPNRQHCSQKTFFHEGRQAEKAETPQQDHLKSEQTEQRKQRSSKSTKKPPFPSIAATQPNSIRCPSKTRPPPSAYQRSPDALRESSKPLLVSRKDGMAYSCPA